MTEDQYNERKWELMWEIKRAFPVLPKVGLARKKRLIGLMMTQEGCTEEEARQWIVDNMTSIKQKSMI